MSSSAPEVLVEQRQPGAFWITINRAHKHNPLSGSVLQALAAAVRLVDADPAARLVLITGAGERYFAAGGDLKALAAVRDEAATRRMCDESRAALDAVRDCGLPVLACLNGDALGGGAELALACDLRLMRAAARIGFIQARLAITSAWGGGPDLCQLIGPSRALRLMARAEMVDADQALAWGLADAVLSADREAEDLHAFIAPMLACPAQVLRGIKAQTRACRQGLPYTERRQVEQQQLLRTWLHDEHWQAAGKLLTKAAR